MTLNLPQSPRDKAARELHALSKVWPRHLWDGKRQGSTSGVCIESTKIAIAALELLGHEVAPLSVKIQVANQQAWDLSHAGVPVDEWPNEAYSVGVDPAQPTGGPGWDGHLIVRDASAQAIADFDFATFNRPGLIDIPTPVLLFPDEHRRPDEPSRPWVGTTDGVYVTIHPATKNTGWKQSGAWRNPVDPWLVDRLAWVTQTWVEAESEQTP